MSGAGSGVIPSRDLPIVELATELRGRRSSDVIVSAKLETESCRQGNGGVFGTVRFSLCSRG